MAWKNRYLTHLFLSFHRTDWKEPSLLPRRGHQAHQGRPQGQAKRKSVQEHSLGGIRGIEPVKTHDPT